MNHRRKHVTAALVATALGIVMQASTPAMAAADYPPGPTVQSQDLAAVDFPPGPTVQGRVLAALAFPPGPSVRVHDVAGPGVVGPEI